ncbi:hypothetical protein D8B30_20520 [Verminephrobacter eiseniae]|nr:hypothetical protein [Verminephrobacter eiseniae]MCW8192019.1 hypothetical protein [Verminephrobacter eiseniae]
MAAEAVLAGRHQHMVRRAAGDDQVRQHDQREAGCATGLHCMRIARLDAEVLGEQRRQHDVRHGGRVTAH